MEDYIVVSSGGEKVEIDLELDGTVSLEVVQSQVGNAIGLKYLNPSTGNFRAVPIKEAVLLPPKGGWGERLYYKVVPTVENDVPHPKVSDPGILKSHYAVLRSL